VAHHHESTARPKHTRHFGERDRRIGHEVHGVRGQGVIDRLVGQGQDVAVTEQHPGVISSARPAVAGTSLAHHRR
jgi:hypothetical protein